MDDAEAAFFSRPKRKIDVESKAAKKRKEDDAPRVEHAQRLDSEDSDYSTDDSATRDTARPVPFAGVKRPAQDICKGKVSGHTSLDNAICLSSDDESSKAASKRISRKKDNPAVSRHHKETIRPRRRSDSLTPPPQLSPRRRMAGAKIIRDAFRSTQPSLSSDVLTTIEPDEAELLFEEQMRQQIASQGQSPKPDGTPASPSKRKKPLVRSNSSFVEEPPDTVIEIVIRGVYVDLPTTKSIIPNVKLWETPRIIKIRLNMRLSIAKIGFCKEAGMHALKDGVKHVSPENQRQMNDILLTYRGVRVFDYVTLHGLGIAAGEQPYLEAHTRDGWKCLELNPGIRKSGISTTSGVRASSGADLNHGIGQTLDDVDRGGSAEEEQYIKITLRAKDGKELKVRSRPSTKIDSIIAGFRRTQSIPDASRIELRFEGDVLAGTMADTEVENDDVIDVQIY